MKSNHHFMGWKWLKRPFGRKRCASLNIGRTWFFCSVLSIQRWKWDKHEWNWSEHETALKTQWSWLWTVLKSHQIWRWHGVVPANKKKPAKISSLNKTQVNHVKWSSWEKKKTVIILVSGGFLKPLLARISNFVADALPANCRATADQRSKRRRTSDLSSTLLCCARVTWRKCHPVMTWFFCGMWSHKIKRRVRRLKSLDKKQWFLSKKGPSFLIYKSCSTAGV